MRNPLAGIRSGLQLLASLFPDAADGRELIRDIVARVDSLNAVMNDLLTFARVRELKRTDIDVASLLADLKASAKLDPAMRDVEIEIHGDTNLTVEGDVDQLRVVVTNLLINAAQAMNHAGRIEVEVASSGPGAWSLNVADHGPGFPAELGERVFEPFFTTKHRGTGLGLPTARRIVEAHGGELTLANAPSGGTVARLILPRHLA